MLAPSKEVYLIFEKSARMTVPAFTKNFSLYNCPFHRGQFQTVHLLNLSLSYIIFKISFIVYATEYVEVPLINDGSMEISFTGNVKRSLGLKWYGSPIELFYQVGTMPI